jgi:hypothetical protein
MPPVILAVAIAVILSLAIATKRVNDVPLVSKNRAVAVKLADVPVGENPIGGSAQLPP